MIAIIKGCGNNIASIQFALERLDVESVLTDDPQTIRSASHVILPGVGSAKRAMRSLRDLGLVEVIKSLQQPVLGICLGMQLLYEGSEEGDVDCLGLIAGKIQRLPKKAAYTLPHMGWNQFEFENENEFFDENLGGGLYSYFIHSYAAPINKYTIATTVYTKAFTSIVKNRNFIGMQFHPERSGSLGERLLKIFIAMR